MSYWVNLEDKDGNSLKVNHHEEGGTFALGGIDEAELNITYNYARIYSKHDFSIKDLNGKTAAETLPKLKWLVEHLGMETDGDYWRPTAGNAGYALSILLQWAVQHPEGIWSVDY